MYMVESQSNFHSKLAPTSCAAKVGTAEDIGILFIADAHKQSNVLFGRIWRAHQILLSIMLLQYCIRIPKLQCYCCDATDTKLPGWLLRRSGRYTGVIKVTGEHLVHEATNNL